MDDNRTSFGLLKRDFFPRYMAWKRQNKEPLADPDFIAEMNNIFAEHHFFSEEMYNLYKNKIEKAYPDREYTRAHHQIIPRILMKEWVEELASIMENADQFFFKGTSKNSLLMPDEGIFCGSEERKP